MTVSSVKTGDLGLSFALNNNFMEPIATTLVGSGGTNNITFNDIPQTYKHLQIRAIGRSSRSEDFGYVVVRFNSDVGSNYAQHYLGGDGSSPATYSSTSTTSPTLYVWPGANRSANIFGMFVLDILDYTNINKNKTLKAFSGVDCNGSGFIGLHSGVWMNTNAITSITMTEFNNNNFVQHTRFSLYGIKG